VHRDVIATRELGARSQPNVIGATNRDGIQRAALFFPPGVSGALGELLKFDTMCLDMEMTLGGARRGGAVCALTRDSRPGVVDNRESVRFGVQTTAGMITGAALIMVAVFAGFAMGELTMFQQMGFGLAIAVILDATIVRTVLVPASMSLLGKWNW